MLKWLWKTSVNMGYFPVSYIGNTERIDGEVSCSPLLHLFIPAPSTLRMTGKRERYKPPRYVIHSFHSAYYSYLFTLFSLID